MGWFSRRRFLGLSVAAGALAAGGAATLYLPDAAPGARILGPNELEIVSALALLLFPGHPMPLDGLQADVPLEVDRLVAELLDANQAMGFRYLLRALERGTQASRGAAFTKLDQDLQRVVFEVWSAPKVLPRRIAADSLKALLSIAYYRHPAIRDTVGWSTTCGVAA